MQIQNKKRKPVDFIDAEVDLSSDSLDDSDDSFNEIALR